MDELFDCSLFDCEIFDTTCDCDGFVQRQYPIWERLRDRRNAEERLRQEIEESRKPETTESPEPSKPDLEPSKALPIPSKPPVLSQWALEDAAFAAFVAAEQAILRQKAEADAAAMLLSLEATALQQLHDEEAAVAFLWYLMQTD